MVTEPGTNAVSNKGAVWIGPGGTYTKTFNNAREDPILIIWAPMLRGSTLTSPSSLFTSPPAHMNHERFVDHEHRRRSIPRNTFVCCSGTVCMDGLR
jgi:hypothetical protein